MQTVWIVADVGYRRALGAADALDSGSARSLAALVQNDGLRGERTCVVVKKAVEVMPDSVAHRAIA